MFGLLSLVTGGLGSGAKIHGDEFRTTGRFFGQLAKPMSVVLDGKSFRQTIEQIAQQSDLNVWIDRKVDPSVLIAAGQLGPNVFLGLQKAAAAQGCVVMPVANVVLVGRRQWVDATAAALMPTADSIPRQDIAWGELTTPRESLAKVMETPLGETLALPHDLWPAVSLQAVQRPVAVNLILSQFGRRLKSANQTDVHATIPLAAKSQRLPRTYTNDENLAAAVQTIKPPPKLDSKRATVSLQMTATEHREITTALLAAADNNAAKRSIDERKFESMKIVDAKAGDILNQLAAMAQMKCTFESDAQAASEQVISLDAKDKTLRQLIELVADKVALKVQWGKDDFQLTKR